LASAFQPLFPLQNKTSVRETLGLSPAQVMQEYAAVAASKLRHNLETVLQQLLLLESFEVNPFAPA
jgi:hypothetical protein